MDPATRGNNQDAAILLHHGVAVLQRTDAPEALPHLLLHQGFPEPGCAAPTVGYGRLYYSVGRLVCLHRYLSMPPHQLLLDEMGRAAQRPLHGHQRYNIVQRRNQHCIRFLESRHTALAAVGPEDALEEEDGCRVDVLRRYFYHRREYPPSPSAGPFRGFEQRELGILRRVDVEHNRGRRWDYVVSIQSLE